MIYDTSSVRSDIEWISGLGDAARGSVARSETATEANILQEGLSNRTGEKVDLLEDWLKDVATFSAEILLQEMPPEMVMQEVGQNAFWPKLDKQTLYDRINVEILLPHFSKSSSKLVSVCSKISFNHPAQSTSSSTTPKLLSLLTTFSK